MSSNNQLKKNSLGLWSLVFFVVAAASPLTGIVGALPIAFLAGNGVGMPGIYVMAGLILALFAVGFVTMSRHVVNAGAFYSYISSSLGPKFGLAGLKIALLAYTAIQISVAAMFGFMTSMFLSDHFGLAMPWWICSVLMLGVVLALGVAKVELGGKLLGLLMLAEVGIVILTALSIVVHGGATGTLEFSSFTPQASFSGAIGIGLIFAISCFVGFEATAIYSEECRDPEKAVPRATLLAVALITLFFTFVSWAFVQATGPAALLEIVGKDPGRFIFVMTEQYVGQWAVEMMSVLLITSLFAATQAFHNTISRYLFSISRDGFLWQGLARTHKEFGTPWMASLVQSLVMIALMLGCGLAALDPMQHVFAWCSAICTLSILLLQAAVSVAVILFFRQHPQIKASFWSSQLAPALAAIGLSVALIKVIENLNVLSGSDSHAIFSLPYLVFGTAALGYGLAWLISQVFPARYARLQKLVESVA
ncbi:APC family permease [Uliginosibacterium sediminicola]|uniref:APC family permease n=1 Tax=Uliginosibacterium sediminicola TaxID=2024550 RepID=A0ABU9YXA7_9RHOO